MPPCWNRRKQIVQLIDKPQDRTELVKLSYRDPSGRQVQEPVARVKDGMGYAIQIRAANGPLPHSLTRAPLNDRPIGFVPLTKGMVYVIRLINPLQTEAVARVEIDNVSTFRYCSLAPAPSLFVVPAGGSIDVPGWVVTLDQSREFLITTFDDSARADVGLNPPGDGLGLISVAFRHSWLQNPPANEGSAKSGTQSAGAKPDLTGLGASIARSTSRCRGTSVFFPM